MAITEYLEITPIVNHLDDCLDCKSLLTDEDNGCKTEYVRSYTSRKRLTPVNGVNRELVEIQRYSWPVCRTCFNANVAMADAVENRRRFTTVGVYPRNIDGGEVGKRCACGNASFRHKDFCVRCFRILKREQEYLAKVKLEYLALVQLSKELRKTIKEKQKCNKQTA